ncbi:MAG: saccharopine dehydrogenase (NAD+, L-lysine-forming) [Parvicellaceae bacterium]|jgi:saccharopine dehydrogenase (NAD+, L-lysine-forming)
MKIGVIREGKVPPDKRVPLSPEQCKIIDDQPGVEVFVQRSEIRKFTDEQYQAQGLKVVKSVEDCDVLIGVKEVPIKELIPGKKYLFFSHTYKEQPYNRDLLKAVIEKNVQLVDWEVITDSKGRRLIAFGRYAGIVGCYNTLLGYGLKSGRYKLKRACNCDDRVEMERQLEKVDLPKNFKIVITGKGRVGGGAEEIFHKMNLTKVSPEDFLTKEFDRPVYTQLGVEKYNKMSDESDFDKSLFYKDPASFESDFLKYARVADIYVACHYWDSRAPFIFSREDARDPNWKISIVGDISCDIDCAVASTLRPSTVVEPFYGYDPISESEVDFDQEGAISVMAVDNLPCELPKDASIDFGAMFINHVLEPLKGNDPDHIIWRASQTKDGKLTPHFEYLQDYVSKG